MYRTLSVLLVVTCLGSNAFAQFTGPSVKGRESTVAQLGSARLGTYVTVTGNIIAHQRADYFTFRDDTGEVRVEISNSVWQGRQVGPESRVRLLGELDSGVAGRYLWIKSLEVVK